MSPLVLSSTSNPQVKAVRALHQRSARSEQQRILIEGPHPVEEAIEAGLKIEMLYVRDGFDCSALITSAALATTLVSADVMSRMSTTTSSPPVLAVATMPQTNQRIQPFSTQLSVVLYHIQDPGNLGTLIRSACAFGVQQLILIGQSTDPYQPKVIRASAGLVFRIPVITLQEAQALKHALSEDPVCILLAADSHQGSSYTTLCVKKRHPVLLLGSEGDGLPPEWSQWASHHQAVHIPCTSSAESLNVAVAGSILMAAWYAQQHQTTHAVE